MKTSWIRFIYEEMQFVKTLPDLERFCQKFPYMAPRLLGWGHKHTSVPISLQIEPTNLCNINCICCPRDQMKRAKGCMELALFRKIIDDACICKIRRVHLYLHGEPFLHPQIVKMIRYVKNKQIGITLATNGMLLNPHIMASILHAGVNNADHFIFSILGFTKEVHEKIMRGVIHEKVIDNVSNFLELRRKYNINGPIIEAIMYIMPENKDEIVTFIQHWRSVVDHVREPGAISEQFDKYNSDNTQDIRNKSCDNLWERMTILWNGDVTICAADLEGKHIIGNVKKKTIKEIWNSDKLLGIKALHKAKQFENLDPCAQCDW